MSTTPTPNPKDATFDANPRGPSLDSIVDAAKRGWAGFTSGLPSLKEAALSAITPSGPKAATLTGGQTVETPDVYIGTTPGAADSKQAYDQDVAANDYYHSPAATQHLKDNIKNLFTTSAGAKEGLKNAASSAAEEIPPAITGLSPVQYAKQIKSGDVAGAVGNMTRDALIAGTFGLAAEHPSIAKQALNEHMAFGGSTTDPRTGASLNGTKNWSVGVAPESTVVSDRPFQPQEFNDFASTHKDTLAQHQNSAIGTHYDPSTGLHHMEVVATTPSKAAAAGAAAHLGENSIFHLGTNESVPTGVNPEADRPLSPLSIDDRFNAVRSATPAKAPFSGTHFSDSKLDTIDGTRRGTSGIGEENARLRLGSQTGMGKDAPAGFYVYQSGSLPEGQLAGRKNAHSVRGQMAFGTTDRPEFQNGYQEGVQSALSKGADPQTAHSLGLNHAEHALHEAGYDGYYNAQNPNTRFVFGSHTPEPSGAYQPPKGIDLDPDRTSGGTRSLKLGVEDPTFSKNVGGFPADQQTSGGSRKLNLGTNTGFAKDLGASARQASESKFGPMRRSGDPVTNNASGESAASQEAINRTRSEASQGIKRFKIDTRSGIETPLFGPDAVDVKASPYEKIVARGPHGETILDQGSHARN